MEYSNTFFGVYKELHKPKGTNSAYYWIGLNGITLFHVDKKIHTLSLDQITKYMPKTSMAKYNKTTAHN